MICVMNRLRWFGIIVGLSVLGTGSVYAQVKGGGSNQSRVGSWTRTVRSPGSSVSQTLLLTDGTVIAQNPDNSGWWKLTPDNTGSYVNGTWTQIASTPSGYGPLYFGSAVLGNGKVVIIGGEYNFGSQSWTNKAAVYDPLANTWSNLGAPSGWSQIGDCQTTVMPDGKWVIANPFDTRMASLNPATMTWTALAGANKQDRFDEEGWTLLPQGSILTCDALNAPHAEKYIPSLDQWISAGNTPHSLEDPNSQEMGPQVLRPDGTVFCTGATGFNAVYTPGPNITDAGTWADAVKFPVVGGQLDIADGPACLLPNGNVLCDASPGVFNSPSHFYEFDGTTLNAAPATPRSGGDSSFVGVMLMLPTGQVLFTDQSSDVEIYTPTGGPQNSWRPGITSFPAVVSQGQTFTLQGTQLNGLSQCSAYGDDSTNATNYPLVMVKNNATGHVTFFRTHDHSTMAVATGAALVSTQVTVPATAETGPSTMQVVTNGISSTPVSITVFPAGVVAPLSFTTISGVNTGGLLTSLYFSDDNYLTFSPAPVVNSAIPPVQVQFSATSPTFSPASFQISLESNVNATGVFQTLYLFNFSTNAYEQVDNRTATNADQSITISGSGTLSRFVNQGTGEVRALVAYKQISASSTPTFTASLDLVNWIIH